MVKMENVDSTILIGRTYTSQKVELRQAFYGLPVQHVGKPTVQRRFSDRVVVLAVDALMEHCA